MPTDSPPTESAEEVGFTIEEMREEFTRMVTTTPSFASNTPLGIMEINGEFHHYMDPNTDTLWLGFGLGMRHAYRKLKGVPAPTPPPDEPSGSKFAEFKEAAARDCEHIATMINQLAAAVREGDMAAFERFWCEGGTEEGDAKIAELSELVFLRHAVRKENYEKS